MTNNIEETKKATREELRKQRQEKRIKREQELEPKKIRIRIIPVWLRVLIVLLLVIASTLIGVAVGYSVIGDGDFSDAFKRETWQHIVDIVKKAK